jgi:hypothetical protein
MFLHFGITWRSIKPLTSGTILRNTISVLLIWAMTSVSGFYSPPQLILMCSSLGISILGYSSLYLSCNIKQNPGQVTLMWLDSLVPLPFLSPMWQGWICPLAVLLPSLFSCCVLLEKIMYSHILMLWCATNPLAYMPAGPSIISHCRYIRPDSAHLLSHPLSLSHSQGLFILFHSSWYLFQHLKNPSQ